MMTEGEQEEFKQWLRDQGLDAVEEAHEQGKFGNSGERHDLVVAFIKRAKRNAEAGHQESAQQLAAEANQIAERANKRAGCANVVAGGSLLAALVALLKAFGVI